MAVSEVPNSNVFLDTKQLTGGKNFILKHNGISKTARVVKWIMDYEYRVSKANDYVDFDANMNQATAHLPGNTKSIALEYEFVDHKDDYSFSTQPILDLIAANANNRQVQGVEFQNVKTLIIQMTGGSNYFVFPSSLDIEKVPAQSITVGKRPPIWAYDPNKERLVITFNDRKVVRSNRRTTT